MRGQAFVDWMSAIGQSTPPPDATAYTVTAPTPASGLINTASGNFTVQPNGPYTGTITITPSGGGLSTPMVQTWANSSAPQTFAITPTVVGTVTLTLTNSGLPYRHRQPDLSMHSGTSSHCQTRHGEARGSVAGSRLVAQADRAIAIPLRQPAELSREAPRQCHFTMWMRRGCGIMFVPWSRRSYRTRGR